MTSVLASSADNCAVRASNASPADFHNRKCFKTKVFAHPKRAVPDRGTLPYFVSEPKICSPQLPQSSVSSGGSPQEKDHHDLGHINLRPHALFHQDSLCWPGLPC